MLVAQGANLVQEIQDLRNHLEQMVNNMREELKQGLYALSVNQNDQSFWQPPNSNNHQVTYTEEDSNYENMLTRFMDKMIHKYKESTSWEVQWSIQVCKS